MESDNPFFKDGEYTPITDPGMCKPRGFGRIPLQKTPDNPSRAYIHISWKTIPFSRMEHILLFPIPACANPGFLEEFLCKLILIFLLMMKVSKVSHSFLQFCFVLLVVSQTYLGRACRLFSWTWSTSISSHYE